MTEPQNPKHLICEKCKKPIHKDEEYCKPRLPSGETKPVHTQCM